MLESEPRHYLLRSSRPNQHPHEWMSENWVCSQSKPSEYVFGEMPTAFACSQNWIREVPLHVLWGSWRLVLSRLILKTYLFQWTHHPTELWNWWLDFTLCQLYNTQKHTRTHKDTHTHTHKDMENSHFTLWTIRLETYWVLFVCEEAFSFSLKIYNPVYVNQSVSYKHFTSTW